MAEEQLKARAVAAEREQEGDDDEDEEDDGMYEGERLRKGWERKISSSTGDVYYYCEVRCASWSRLRPSLCTPVDV